MKTLKPLLKFSLLIILTLLVISIFLGHTNIGNFNQNESEEKKFLTIGDEKIRFIQKGDGKDILFIHGTPGSIEDWTILIDNLAKDFRVTAFDRVGHGFSSSNEYSYHLEENAELVEELIQKLKLKKPMIIGHSYGGSIAVQMAVNSKLENRKYVIIDSPFYEIEPSFVNRLVAAPIMGKGIAFLSAFTIAKREIRKGVLAMFDSPKNQNKIDFYIEERQKMWSQPKVIYSNAKEIVNLPTDLKSITEKYINIEAEISLITTKAGKNTFKYDSEKLHNTLKNSYLYIIPNSGHYIQIEKSKEILKIIKEFHSLN